MKRTKIFNLALLTAILVLSFAVVAFADDNTVANVGIFTLASETTESNPAKGVKGSTIETNFDISFCCRNSVAGREIPLELSATVEGSDNASGTFKFVQVLSGAHAGTSIAETSTIANNTLNLTFTGEGTVNDINGNVKIKLSFTSTTVGKYKVTVTVTGKGNMVDLMGGEDRVAATGVETSKTADVYFEVSDFTTNPVITPASGTEFTGKATQIHWSQDVVITAADANSITIADNILKTLRDYGISTDITQPTADNSTGKVRFATSADNPIAQSTKSEGVSITVTAKNSHGSSNASYKFKTVGDKTPLDSEAFKENGEGSLYVDNKATQYLATNTSYVDTRILLSSDVALPILWKANKLPTGIEASVDQTNPRLFHIAGKPTKTGTYNYTIEVGNKTLSKTKIIPNTVTVEDVLAENANIITLKDSTTGTAYSATTKLSGFTSWDISYDSDAIAMATVTQTEDETTTQVLDNSKLPITAKYTLGNNTLSVTGQAANLKFYPPTGSYDVILKISNDVTEAPVTRHIRVPVKTVAPRLATTTLNASLTTALTDTAGKLSISAGTLPISFDFEIAETDLAKIFFTSADTAKALVNGKKGYEQIKNVLGLDVTNALETSADGYVTLTGTAKYALKSFPVSVKMYNPNNPTTPVSTRLQITAKGDAPKFKTTASTTPYVIKTGATAAELQKFCDDHADLFTVTGSNFMDFTATGLPSGVTLSKDKVTGDGSSDNPFVIGLTGTLSTTTKFTITITAQNVEGKATQKIILEPRAAVATPTTQPTQLKDLTLESAYNTAEIITGASKISFDSCSPYNPFTITLDESKSKFTLTAAKDKLKDYPGNGSFDLVIYASNDVNTDGPVALQYRIPAKAVKPQLKTTALSATLPNSFNGATLTASGTLPINFDYAIDEAEIKKVVDTYSLATSADRAKSIGLEISFDATHGTATVSASGDKVALKNFPILIALEGPGGDKATTTLRVSVTGAAPKFAKTAPTIAYNVEANGGADALAKLNELISDCLKLSAGSETLSYDLTLPTGITNLVASKEPAVGNTTPFTLKFTAQDAKFPDDVLPGNDYIIKLNVHNTEGKATQTIKLHTAKALPAQTTVPTSLDKTLEINKAYTGKVTVTGAKNYEFVGAYYGQTVAAASSESGAPRYGATNSSLYTDTTTFRVSTFDPSKGTLTFTGTMTTYPENSDASIDLLLNLSNDIPGVQEYHFRIPIKTVAPSLKTKTLTLTQGTLTTSAKLEATGTTPISFDFAITDDDFKNVSKDASNATLAQKFAELGLVFADDTSVASGKKDGTYTFTGTPKIVVKNLPIKITLTNPNGTATGELKLTINGSQPTFSERAPTTPIILAADSSSTGDATKKAQFAKFQEAIKPYLKFSGSPTITFAASGVEGLVASEDVIDNTRTLTVTGTAPTKTGLQSLKFTVTNAIGSKIQTIPVKIASAVTSVATPYVMRQLDLGNDYSQTLKFTGDAANATMVSQDGNDLFTVDYNASTSTITVKTKSKISNYPVDSDGSFDIPIKMSNDVNTEWATACLRIPIKTIAPKFPNTKDFTTTLTSGFNGTKIIASGTLPISFDFGIDTAALANIGATVAGSATSSDRMKALGIELSFDAKTGTASLSTSGDAIALKKFPISVKLEGPGGTTSGRITVTVTGTKPGFVKTADPKEPFEIKASDNTSLVKLNELISLDFRVTGSEPFSTALTGTIPTGWAISKDPKPAGADYTQFVFSTDKTVPAAGKYTMTLKVTNSEGSISRKFIVQTSNPLTTPSVNPYATLTILDLGTSYTKGKATFAGAKHFELVGAYAGEQPSQQQSNTAGKPRDKDGTEESKYAAGKASFDVKITDTNKGTIEIKTKSPISTYPEYSNGSYDIWVKLSNDIDGIADVHFRLPIKTVVPKLKATKMELTYGSPVGNSATLSTTGTLPVSFDISITPDNFRKIFPNSTDNECTLPNMLAAIGLTLPTDDSGNATGTFAFSGTPTVAIKSLPITVKLTNPNTKNSLTGAPVSTTVTLSVSGNKPKFTGSAPKDPILIATGATNFADLNEALANILTFTGSPVLSLDHNLPANLTLTLNGSTSTWTVGGTAPTEKGTSNVTVKLTNNMGSDTQKFSLKFGDAVKSMDTPIVLAKEITLGDNYTGTYKFENGATSVAFNEDGTVEPEAMNMGSAFSLSYNNSTLTVTANKASLTEYPVKGDGSFDIPIVMSNALNEDGKPAEAHLKIKVKSTSPKLTTSALSGTVGEQMTARGGTLVASGTTPISFDVTIDPDTFADVFKDLSADAKTNLKTLTKIEDQLAFLGLTIKQDNANPNEFDYDDLTMNNNSIVIEGEPLFAFAKLPITVKMYNPATGYGASASAVSKTVNFAVSGNVPKFKATPPKDGFTIIAGAEGDVLKTFSEDVIAEYLELSAGSYPLTITATGLPVGLSLDVNNEDLDELPVLQLAGEKISETARKYSVTITAKNGSGTATQKFTIEVMAPVTFASGPLALKNATFEKAYSATVQAATGTKPISWYLAGDNDAPDAGDFTGDYEEADDLKKDFGLSINKSTGAITASKIAKYSADIRFYVVAQNAVSVASREVTIKTDLPTPKITPPKLSEGTRGKTYPTATFSATGYCPLFLVSVNSGNFVSVDSAAGNDEVPLIPGLVFKDSKSGTFAYDSNITDNDWPTSNAGTNTMTITGTPTDVTSTDATAVKAMSFVVRVIGPNYNPNDAKTYADKTMTITVRDQAPGFSATTYNLGTLTSNDEMEIDDMHLNKGSGEYVWSVSGTGNGLTATFEGETDGKVTKDATQDVKLTIKTENFRKATATLTLNVVHKLDSKLKASTKLTFKIGEEENHTNPSFGEAPDEIDTGKKPELEDAVKPETESEISESSDETDDEQADDEQTDEELVTITLGAERSAESLTDAEKAALEGYVIAAILPEISVTENAQYDLDVDLDENVPEGAHIVWFAFPRNSLTTDDDEIVDFATSTGEPTEIIPGDHFVTASPWLTDGVTYAPVIAVNADEAAKLEAEKAESDQESESESETDESESESETLESESESEATESESESEATESVLESESAEPEPQAISEETDE